MNLLLYFPFCILIIFQLLVGARSFIVTVDKNSEECFFERAEDGSKVIFTFEVIEDAFFHVDITVTGPYDDIIYYLEKESSGKLEFHAVASGIHKICFNNRRNSDSSMNRKVVMFTIDVIEPSYGSRGYPNNDKDKLEDMIIDLSVTLSSIKQEQEFMLKRVMVHHSIDRSTISQVLSKWSNFDAGGLVAMVFVLFVAQVFYLRRFFEVKEIA